MRNRPLHGPVSVLRLSIGTLSVEKLSTIFTPLDRKTELARKNGSWWPPIRLSFCGKPPLRALTVAELGRAAAKPTERCMYRD